MDNSKLIIYIVITVVFSYLLGSISPSTIIARRRGIDIKKEGSGNAGTTNALRVLGGKAAIITLVVDILKGTSAVLLAELIAGDVFFGYLACAAAFLGHVFPVYYGLKGGKGVAVAFGGLMGINWKLALLLLLITAIITVLTKRMSAGSITGAVSALILSRFMEADFLPYAILIAGIIIAKHKGNIERLIEGVEPPMSIFIKNKKEEK